MAISRVTVLTSGRGSNLRALLEAERDGRLEGTIAAVISNRAAIPALDIAAAHGVPCFVVPSRDYADRADFDMALAEAIDATEPDLVVLAGFMRILGPAMVGALRGPDAQHPSVAAAFVSRSRHAPPRAGGRRAHPRLHGAFRDRDARPRPDRRAGRGTRAAEATTKRRWPRACSRSSTGCCRRRCARSARDGSSSPGVGSTLRTKWCPPPRSRSPRPTVNPAAPPISTSIPTSPSTRPRAMRDERRSPRTRPSAPFVRGCRGEPSSSGSLLSIALHAALSFWPDGRTTRRRMPALAGIHRGNAAAAIAGGDGDGQGAAATPAPDRDPPAGAQSRRWSRPPPASRNRPSSSRRRRPSPPDRNLPTETVAAAAPDAAPGRTAEDPAPTRRPRLQGVSRVSGLPDRRSGLPIRARGSRVSHHDDRRSQGTRGDLRARAGETRKPRA